MKINGWSTTEKYSKLEFGLEFARDWSIEEHFSFVELYLELTTKYSICYMNIEKENQSYLDYLKFTWNSYGRFVPSNLVGYKHYSGDVNFPITTIGFFKDEAIVLKDVNLLYNDKFNACYIESIKEGKWHLFKMKNTAGEYFSGSRPPIRIDLNRKIKGHSMSHNDLIGEIRCDIWFDHVRNLKIWNQDGSDYERVGDVNNTELAMVNTPRLNSFLRDLKKLGEKFNGKWFFEPNGFNAYEDHAIPINGEILYF